MIETEHCPDCDEFYACLITQPAFICPSCGRPAWNGDQFLAWFDRAEPEQRSEYQKAGMQWLLRNKDWFKDG